MTRISLLLVMVAACAGDDGGTGQTTGNGTFTPTESISAVVTIDEESAAEIVIANTSGLCADARATPPIDRQGQKYIKIDLADTGGASSTAPTAPGTYTIYPNTGSRPAKSASFVVGTLDDTCNPDDASGQSGTVVLTTVSAGKFAGTYDVVLNTGDHVTGSFDPQACSELQTAATTSPHACKP